jgi:hypothetical protein
MPIELGIWRLGNKLEPVTFTSLDAERKLEDYLAKDLSLVHPRLMLVGRQVTTAFGKHIDLLAMDDEGNLVVIELKRDRTPREVVAQLLDYGSWVSGLSRDGIVEIFATKNSGRELEKGFDDAFGISLPDEINLTHRLIVVATDLDPSTERIINYLANQYGVPINAVFFRYFTEGKSEYLARTWLIDPTEAESKASKSTSQKGSETWNGRDFYVALGEGGSRNWDDCRKYGFVSGGGGRWYSQTLQQLFPGARVFACIPGTGYVGVGIVKEAVKPVKDFTVMVNGKETPILKAPLEAPAMGNNSNDAELSEYVVRVEWIKAVSRDHPHWEKGMFANQNTVCKLRNRFTLERLIKHFGLED